MKTLILVSLFSFSALATCPQLSGVYKECTADTSMSMFQLKEIKMVQTNQLFTVDTLDNYEATNSIMLKADGKSRTETVNQDGTVYQMTTKAVCMGNKLVVNFQAFGMTEIHTYSKDSNGALIWDVSLQKDHIGTATCK